MPVCRSACLQVFEIAGLEFVCVFGHDGASLFQKGRVLAQDAIKCARRSWNRCLLCSGRRETQSFRRQGRLNSEEMNWMSGCAFYLFIRQPMGRKSALRREIPWILRGFQGRLSC